MELIIHLLLFRGGSFLIDCYRVGLLVLGMFDSCDVCFKLWSAVSLLSDGLRPTIDSLSFLPSGKNVGVLFDPMCSFTFAVSSSSSLLGGFLPC